MFSSMEMAVRWASEVSGVPASTQVPPDASDGAFVLVDRTGGQLDYPHDSPELSFQAWARDEADAESIANTIAIACKLSPPSDYHVNDVGVPSVYSYGREERGWWVWQATATFQVNLQD